MYIKLKCSLSGKENIYYVSSKIMEMNSTQQNKVALYLFNNINFKIKKIEFKNHGSIIISNNLFNKLKQENNAHYYTVSFVSENIESNHEKIGTKEIDLSSIDDLAYSENVKKNMNYVKYASIVCIVIFIIVIIVVNKNIISDLRNNMNLEVKLGYTNFQIKMNILKRLLLLHLLSFVIAIAISSIVILGMNIVSNMGIGFDFIYKNALLILIILLSDILLSLFLKIR